jgi:hypothetical protein
MFALAYASRALQSFDQYALHDLAQRAAAKNEQLGVTGYLSFRQDVFLQYLEGEQKVVEDLMRVITADERHEVLRQIPLGERSDRVFDDWSMRYLSPNEITEIGLADVLEGVMLTMVSKAVDQSAALRMVLRLVEKIAAQRKRLRERRT